MNGPKGEHARALGGSRVPGGRHTGPKRAEGQSVGTRYLPTAPPIFKELTKLKSGEYVEFLFENGEEVEPHV